MFNVFADGQSIYFPLDEELVIIKPKLTLEMGKAGSFEFSIPPTHRFYPRIQKLKTIITVEYDGVEIFRGRVLTNNRSFNNFRKIYCEGDLAYLVDSVQKNDKYTGTTHDLFQKIITNHNARVDAYKHFAVGNITIENREIVISGKSDDIKDLETNKFNYKQIAINSSSTDWSTSLDYLVNNIINYTGGYLRTRRVGNTTYLDLLKDYGSTSIQTIEFGKNLIDLTEEVKAEDLYTVLIPIGDDNLTIEKVNNGSDELVDEAGVARYGRIVKTNVFDNVNNAQTLLENGRRMLENHENMPITFTMKAVDMHLLDDSEKIIFVGDRVYVRSAPHDITDYLTCTKIEYDFENHGNDTYTFGNPKQTLTERYKKDKEKSSKSGHSGSSGGSGGVGAAVEEAAEDYTTQEIAKKSEEIFETWIKTDPSAGTVTLGALYKQVQEGKDILKRTAGIDIDAPKGTVDIYSMNETLNANGQLIKNAEARIQTLANSDEAQIKMFADYKKENDSSLSQLIQRADKDEATLSTLVQHDTDITSSLVTLTQKADKYAAFMQSQTEFNSKTNKTMTTIQQTSDSNSSRIGLVATQANNNGKAIGEIQITVKDMESNINLKADKITLDAEIIDAKKAMRVEFNQIVADKLKAGFVSSGLISCASLVAAANVVAKNGGFDNGLTAKNIVANSSLKIGSDAVATQKWVNEQLKSYAKTSHKHTVAIGHKHTVKVGATTYDTSNIAAGTSATRTTSTAV